MRDTETPAPTQSPGTTAPTRPLEEIAHLGDEIYEQNIRSHVEDDHHGEVVSIDVDTGTGAIGNDVIAATDHLRTQRPEAIDIWSVRVGYHGVYHFGGRPLRKAE